MRIDGWRICDKRETSSHGWSPRHSRNHPVTKHWGTVYPMINPNRGFWHWLNTWLPFKSAPKNRTSESYWNRGHQPRIAEPKKIWIFPQTNGYWNGKLPTDQQLQTGCAALAERIFKQNSTWAVFKIPLSFHYTGCLIGIPLLEYYDLQYIG